MMMMMMTDKYRVLLRYYSQCTVVPDTHAALYNGLYSKLSTAASHLILAIRCRKKYLKKRLIFMHGWMNHPLFNNIKFNLEFTPVKCIPSIYIKNGKSRY
jgi:hypothetical protein